MENIDRFFDSYDRFIPSWCSDLLVTAILFSPLLLIFR